MPYRNELAADACRMLKEAGVPTFSDGSYIVTGAAIAIGDVGYAAYWPDQKLAEEIALEIGVECVRFMHPDGRGQANLYS